MTSGSNPIVRLNEFTYQKGVSIYGEKEHAEYVYQVKTGAVRSHKLLTDGRRQIGAFHLVGDIFGGGRSARLPTKRTKWQELPVFRAVDFISGLPICGSWAQIAERPQACPRIFPLFRKLSAET